MTLSQHVKERYDHLYGIKPPDAYTFGMYISTI
jgi:hypothetical protein